MPPPATSVRADGNKFSVQFKGKQSFCGGTFSLCTGSLHSRGQGVYVRDAALAALEMEGHPKPGEPTPNGASKADIKAWKDVARDAAAVAKKRWEAEHSDQVTEVVGKFRCAKCDGEVCNWSHDVKAQNVLASYECACNFLSLRKYPGITGFVFDNPYKDGQITKADTSASAAGHWQMRNGTMMPPRNLRVAPQFRGTAEAIDALATLQKYDSNHLDYTRVRSLDESVQQYNRDRLRVYDQARRGHDTQDILGNEPHLLLSFEEEGVTPPIANAMSATDIVTSIMNDAFDTYGNDPDILLVTSAIKATGDLKEHYFQVRGNEDLGTLCAGGREWALLRPLPDGKSGTNFFARDFCLRTSSVNGTHGKIPYFCISKVFERNNGTNAAFDFERELDAAMLARPEMDDPTKRVVHINEVGGGNGNRHKKPGFGMASAVVMVFRRDQFAFNQDREFSLEQMWNVPKEFRKALPKSDTKRELSKQRNKDRNERHERRKEEHNKKENAILAKVSVYCILLF